MACSTSSGQYVIGNSIHGKIVVALSCDAKPGFGFSLIKDALRNMAGHLGLKRPTSGWRVTRPKQPKPVETALSLLVRSHMRCIGSAPAR